MAIKVPYKTIAGYRLEFEAFPQTGAWRHVAGIYCFAYNAAGTWRALYVGQTNSFQNRIPSHERWAEARRRGATHVLATVVLKQSDRDILERALIAELDPPLNVQYT